MLLLLHVMLLGTLTPATHIGEVSEAATMEASEASLKESAETTPGRTPEANPEESYEAPPVESPEVDIPDPPAAPEGFILKAIPDPSDLNQGKPRCITYFIFESLIYVLCLCIRVRS